MKIVFKKIAIVILAMGCLQASAGEGGKNTTSPNALSLLPDKEIRGGGFFFHIGGYLPSKGYMFSKGESRDDINDTYTLGLNRYKVGLDLEMGSMFRLADINPVAIGLRTTWFGGNFASRSINDTVSVRTFSLRALRLGPYLTYSMDDKMALDLFYQIGPQFTVLTDNKWDSWNSDIFGLSHELGLGYRIDKLSLVLAYNFGGLVNWSHGAEYRNGPDTRDFARIRTGAFRLAVGVKI